jgi:hypothetical protein
MCIKQELRTGNANELARRYGLKKSRVYEIAGKRAPLRNGNEISLTKKGNHD